LGEWKNDQNFEAHQPTNSSIYWLYPALALVISYYILISAVRSTKMQDMIHPTITAAAAAPSKTVTRTMPWDWSEDPESETPRTRAGGAMT